MEKINTVVDGRLLAVPVLTASHLVAMNKIRSGINPGCPPDILQDLVQAGLVDEPNEC